MKNILLICSLMFNLTAFTAKANDPSKNGYFLGFVDSYINVGIRRPNPPTRLNALFDLKKLKDKTY